MGVRIQITRRYPSLRGAKPRSNLFALGRAPRPDLGFTFIEVLVAMLIFVLAVLAAVDVARGSVRATTEAKTITQATWLLQRIMVEMESKLEGEGIEKACEKKTEGKFDDHEGYTWVAYCNEIDIKLSQTAAKLMEAAQQGEEGTNEPTREDMIQKMILDTASEYISKSLRELHVEVLWMHGKQNRHVSATTHVVRYDLPMAIPGLGAGIPGGGGGGTQ